jgi:hypothetical protein
VSPNILRSFASNIFVAVIYVCKFCPIWRDIRYTAHTHTQSEGKAWLEILTWWTPAWPALSCGSHKVTQENSVFFFHIESVKWGKLSSHTSQQWRYGNPAEGCLTSVIGYDTLFEGTFVISFWSLLYTVRRHFVQRSPLLSLWLLGDHNRSFKSTKATVKCTDV